MPGICFNGLLQSADRAPATGFHILNDYKALRILPFPAAQSRLIGPRMQRSLGQGFVALRGPGRRIRAAR
jgi:hypothetical protein